MSDEIRLICRVQSGDDPLDMEFIFGMKTLVPYRGKWGKILRNPDPLKIQDLIGQVQNAKWVDLIEGGPIPPPSVVIE